jgi:hypothetical protein
VYREPGQLTVMVGKAKTEISAFWDFHADAGRPIVVGANISSPSALGALHPTGTVTFLSDSKPIPSCTDLPVGASCTTTPTKAAICMVYVVVYSGDANYEGSRSPAGTGFGLFPGQCDPPPSSNGTTLPGGSLGPAQATAVLQAVLRAGVDAAKPAVVKALTNANTKSFGVVLASLGPGTHDVKLTTKVKVPGTRAGAAKIRRVVVAAGRLAVAAATQVTVQVKVTAAGQKLLRKTAKRRGALSIALAAKFTPTVKTGTATPVAEKRTIKVRPLVRK